MISLQDLDQDKACFKCIHSTFSCIRSEPRDSSISHFGTETEEKYFAPQRHLDLTYPSAGFLVNSQLFSNTDHFLLFYSRTSSFCQPAQSLCLEHSWPGLSNEGPVELVDHTLRDCLNWSDLTTFTLHTGLICRIEWGQAFRSAIPGLTPPSYSGRRFSYWSRWSCCRYLSRCCKG